jgi:hypothetical protein
MFTVFLVVLFFAAMSAVFDLVTPLVDLNAARVCKSELASLKAQMEVQRIAFEKSMMEAKVKEEERIVQIISLQSDKFELIAQLNGLKVDFDQYKTQSQSEKDVLNERIAKLSLELESKDSQLTLSISDGLHFKLRIEQLSSQVQSTQAFADGSISIVSFMSFYYIRF